MESDEALMLRVQHGDADAFDALFARHHAHLYGFLLRRVGDAAADDLFQETWLRVVRARDRFDPRRRFSTWLFQIANNLCRDEGRRRGVRTKAHELLREHGREERADPRLRTSAAALRLDVRRQLAALPDRLREVLVLRYYQQLSEREIAAVVGIPAGTVKSRLHSAVRALRAGFGEEARGG